MDVGGELGTQAAEGGDAAQLQDDAKGRADERQRGGHEGQVDEDTANQKSNVTGGHGEVDAGTGCLVATKRRW